MSLPVRQAQVFAVMLVCGLVLGAAYNALEIARRLCLGKKAACAFLDLCFGPLCALVLIAAALYLRTEVLRWYVLLAAAVGAGLYAVCPGRLLRRAAAWALRLRRKKRAMNRS